MLIVKIVVASHYRFSSCTRTHELIAKLLQDYAFMCLNLEHSLIQVSLRYASKVAS